MEDALRRRPPQDNYVAMLAHELRNPLAPIRNAVHLLKAEDRSPVRRPSARGNRPAESPHGDAARRPAQREPDRPGTTELRREQVGLRTVIASALETTQPAIEARNHRVEVRLRAGPGASRRSVPPGPVFANLFTNAVRYTAEGGHHHRIGSGWRARRHHGDRQWCRNRAGSSPRFSNSSRRARRPIASRGRNGDRAGPARSWSSCMREPSPPGRWGRARSQFIVGCRSVRG